MNEHNPSEVMDQRKSLVSEGNSLSARIQEYEDLLAKRNEEIALLQTMVENANAMRSSLENQLLELQQLQQHFTELKRMAEKTKDTISSSPLMSRTQYEEQIALLVEENASLKLQLASAEKGMQ